MDGFAPWAGKNWFDLIQTLGIVVGFFMSASASRKAARAKHSENLLQLAEHHRELWTTALQHDALARILVLNTNVVEQPPTTAEMVFLNNVFIHFETSWHIANSGGVVTPKVLATDLRGFLSLPLPRAVWEKTKAFRNRKFVRFVERALQ